jgi:hypothetical protein
MQAAVSLQALQYVQGVFCRWPRQRSRSLRHGRPVTAGLANHGANGIQRAGSRDGHHPCRRTTALGIETWRLAPHLPERVLQDLFSASYLLRDPQSDDIHPCRLRSIQFSQCRLVLAHDSRYEQRKRVVVQMGDIGPGMRTRCSSGILVRSSVCQPIDDSVLRLIFDRGCAEQSLGVWGRAAIRSSVQSVRQTFKVRDAHR